MKAKKLFPDITFKKLLNKQVDMMYPVGSIYMSVNDTSPTTLFGGTWERIKDTFLLSAGDTYAGGSVGGESTHTLTIDEMPSHEGHLETNGTNMGGNIAAFLNNTILTVHGSIGRGWNVQMGNEIVPAGHTKGSGLAHNNMPPYLAVFVWKRTA